MRMLPEEGTIQSVEVDASDQVSGSELWLGCWEILSVITSFLIAEWMILPLAANSRLLAAVPLVFALALILYSQRVRRETPREIGWRLDNFPQAMRLLILPMMGAALLILGIGYLKGSLRFNGRQLLEWALWLPLWGVIQQYVLQGFINRRLQMLVGRGWTCAILVGLIFALLHLPNPWLSVATLAGGIIWARVYHRAPNLLALALSHAIMSILLACSLPPSVLNSLRVGVRYFG